jgi:DNA-binding XRE family transcriptional regulator
MKDWKSAEDEFLKDWETKVEFETLRPHYEVVSQVINARNRQGLTQAQLAERTGIARSNISRLESGNYNPSLDFLQKIAHGLGLEVHVEFRTSLR